MTTAVQERMSERDAARLRKMIHHSRRAFHCGCLAIIPVAGLYFGVLATIHGFRARWYRGNAGNPVRRQAGIGVLLGAAGIVTTIVLLLAKGAAHSRSSVAFGFLRGLLALGFLFAYGLGLAAITQLARGRLFTRRWTRRTAVAVPMLLWTALFLVWLGGVAGMPEAASVVAVCLAAAVPLIVLVAAVLNARVNRFFHRHRYLALLCILWSVALLVAGMRMGPTDVWPPGVDPIDFAIGISVVLVVLGAVVPMERLLRTRLSAVWGTPGDESEFYHACLLALLVFATVSAMVAFYALR